MLNCFLLTQLNRGGSLFAEWEPISLQITSRYYRETCNFGLFTLVLCHVSIVLLTKGSR